MEVDTFSQVKSRRYYSNCLIEVSRDAKALVTRDQFSNVFNQRSFFTRRNYDARSIWLSCGRRIRSDPVKSTRDVANSLQFNDARIFFRRYTILRPSFASHPISATSASHYTLLFRDYFCWQREKNHIHRGSVADNKRALCASRQDISPRVECTRILSVSRQKENRTRAPPSAKVGPLREGGGHKKLGGD